jgi:putative hydrolase of the HAD superfamily
MHTAGIDSYFDAVILSEDIGVNKPDCRLYRHALDHTTSALEESIMIGDMFDTDIAGAANIGMDSIYYNPNGKSGHPFKPTYEVKHLLEIKEIL